MKWKIFRQLFKLGFSPGFTLPEVMIAVAGISVLGLALMSVSLQTMNSLYNADEVECLVGLKTQFVDYLTRDSSWTNTVNDPFNVGPGGPLACFTNGFVGCPAPTARQFRIRTSNIATNVLDPNTYFYMPTPASTDPATGNTGFTTGCVPCNPAGGVIDCPITFSLSYQPNKPPVGAPLPKPGYYSAASAAGAANSSGEITITGIFSPSAQAGSASQVGRGGQNINWDHYNFTVTRNVK